MPTLTAKTSPQIYARIVGILFLVIMITPISNPFLPNEFIVAEDAVATAHNIIDSEAQFRIQFAGHIVVLFADIGLSVLLYVLLEPVSSTLSLIAAVFRLVMVAIRGANLIHHFSILLFLSGADYLTVFEPNQLDALVLQLLKVFDYGVVIDLVFFGPHLLIVGYLVFKSGYLPKILGILSMLAGLSYLIDGFAIVLMPDYGVRIALFTFWGELLLGFWLLIKGVNVERWEKRTSVSD